MIDAVQLNCISRQDKSFIKINSSTAVRNVGCLNLLHIGCTSEYWGNWLYIFSRADISKYFQKTSGFCRLKLFSLFVAKDRSSKKVHLKINYIKIYEIRQNIVSKFALLVFYTIWQAFCRQYVLSIEYILLHKLRLSHSSETAFKS